MCSQGLSFDCCLPSLLALALKSIDYETIPVNLLKDGGQQVRRLPPGHNVGAGGLGEGPSRGYRLPPPRGKPVLRGPLAREGCWLSFVGQGGKLCSKRSHGKGPGSRLHSTPGFSMPDPRRVGNEWVLTPYWALCVCLGGHSVRRR